MNPEKTREALFSCLNSVLVVSQKKFKMEQKKDYSRLKWGGLIVRAVQAYGKLLEVHELEQMAKDIEQIKEKVGL